MLNNSNLCIGTLIDFIACEVGEYENLLQEIVYKIIQLKNIKK